MDYGVGQTLVRQRLRAILLGRAIARFGDGEQGVGANAYDTIQRYLLVERKVDSKALIYSTHVSPSVALNYPDDDPEWDVAVLLDLDTGEEIPVRRSVTYSVY